MTSHQCLSQSANTSFFSQLPLASFSPYHLSLLSYLSLFILLTHSTTSSHPTVSPIFLYLTALPHCLCHCLTVYSPQNTLTILSHHIFLPFSLYATASYYCLIPLSHPTVLPYYLTLLSSCHCLTLIFYHTASLNFLALLSSTYCLIPLPLFTALSYCLT